MKEYQKLLVVIDPTTDIQPALARAVELAEHNDAAITVFLSIFDLSYEMTSILSSHEREAMRQGVIAQRIAWVDDIIAPYQDQGISINTQVIWHNRPFESIIQYAIQHDYQLIVKATHEHDKLKAVIFTPTDWHLLRKAPMPVLMVNEHEWTKNGKILCAVNVATDEQNHETLNEKIIKHGLDLASKFNADVHLINGYPGTPVNLAIELPDFDANNFTQSVRRQHLEAVHKLADSFGIAHDHCHVQEGLPEDVIPELAAQLDTELVILGTIGRTALSAALIGNTAEHVIDSLNCDLLAIKPEGYRSPLETE